GWSSRELLDTTLLFSSFGEDEAGRLYAVHYGSGLPNGPGRIYRLADANPAPTGTPTSTPTPTGTATPTGTPTSTPASSASPTTTSSPTLTPSATAQP